MDNSKLLQAAVFLAWSLGCALMYLFTKRIDNRITGGGMGFVWFLGMLYITTMNTVK